MSRLVLHIGLPKTGTTTVQDTLCANMDRLEAQGLVYPQPGYGTGHHEFMAGRAEIAGLLPLAYLPEGGSEQLWRDLAARHASSDRTVVLSSELFSVRSGDFRARMEWIAGLTAAFDERRVVCVLRDPISLLQSVYLEATKKRVMPPFGHMLEEVRSTGGIHGTSTDFLPLYEPLTEVFGPEAVTLLSHGALSGQPNGILNAILAEARAGASVETLGLETRAWSNRSPEPLALLAARMIAPEHLLPPELIHRAETALRAHFGETARTTLFSRPEIAQAEAHFAAINEQLQARLRQDGKEISLAFPDWSDRIHREDINAGFWLEFCRSLYSSSAA